MPDSYLFFGWLRRQVSSPGILLSPRGLLKPVLPSLSGIHGRDLLLEGLFVILEICEAFLVQESNLLDSAILGNLLVEVTEPEHDAGLVQDTLLISTLVVCLVFVERTEHRRVHLFCSYGKLTGVLIEMLHGPLDLDLLVLAASLTLERIAKLREWGPTRLARLEAKVRRRTLQITLQDLIDLLTQIKLRCETVSLLFFHLNVGLVICDLLLTTIFSFFVHILEGSDFILILLSTRWLSLTDHLILLLLNCLVGFPWSCISNLQHTLFILI